MSVAKHIWHGVGMIPCGGVNCYLLDSGPDGLILVDAGWPGKTDKVVDGIRNLGHQLHDVKHIVLTHAHVDHIGGLADMVRLTGGAQTWMHETDAGIAEKGSGFRHVKPAPELAARLMYRLVYKPGGSVEPARIDHKLKNDELIPLAGGLRTIPVPGHCAGQIAVLWDARRALFVGDTCTNLLGLGSPIGYEDEVEGRRSQRKLCEYSYDLACFGHGRPLVGDAASKMRRHWLKETAQSEPAAH